MEAGAAAVSHLAEHPEIYTRLEAQGQRLADAVNGFCETQNIPAQLKHVGSMFHMFFQREPVYSARDAHNRHLNAQKAFYLHALNQGVLVPGTQRAFLSAAHTDATVEQIIAVFQNALLAVAAEGLF